VQADQRLTRPHAGAGLGLAIRRDLAPGTGGDLTAESTPRAGSTVHTAPADDAWALAAGCDAVLHKPASAAALVREVRRLAGDDAAEPIDDSGSPP
jgi:CheY-like chemotaxis protein